MCLFGIKKEWYVWLHVCNMCARVCVPTLTHSDQASISITHNSTANAPFGIRIFDANPIAY